MKLFYECADLLSRDGRSVSDMIGRFASSRSTPLFITFTISLIITCICTTYKVSCASYANIVIKLHDATICPLYSPSTQDLGRTWRTMPLIFFGEKNPIALYSLPSYYIYLVLWTFRCVAFYTGREEGIRIPGASTFPLAPHPCFNFYWGAKYLIWGPRKKIEVNHLTRYIFAPHQKRFEVGQHLWR